MNLQGKKVVIIGGRSGIGLATAKAAVTAGAKVLLAGRSLQKLAQAQAEIGGGEISSLDLLQEDAVKKFFAEVGIIDHLVISGSSVTAGSFQELETSDVRKSVDSKFWGAYLAAKYAQMQEQGSIVLFSGTLSHRPSPGYAVVSAINGAIEALGRALVELAPVRVNVVSPGVVATPIYEGMSQQREAFFQNTASKLPVKRIGVPENIAATVLHLMNNGFTTGTVIGVDGGGLLI